jgi:hypothetical protein
MGVALSQASDLITAAGVSLPTIGTGIAWIWRKMERRFEHIEVELKACRDREVASHERRAIQRTVIELLWQEVERFAPHSSTLGRAKHLLERLKDDGQE